MNYSILGKKSLKYETFLSIIQKLKIDIFTFFPSFIVSKKKNQYLKRKKFTLIEKLHWAAGTLCKEHLPSLCVVRKQDGTKGSRQAAGQ